MRRLKEGVVWISVVDELKLLFSGSDSWSSRLLLLNDSFVSSLSSELLLKVQLRVGRAEWVVVMEDGTSCFKFFFLLVLLVFLPTFLFIIDLLGVEKEEEFTEVLDDLWTAGVDELLVLLLDNKDEEDLEREYQPNIN